MSHETWLSRQFPRRCGCGRQYADMAAWEALSRLAVYVDDLVELDLRICVCGDVIVLPLALGKKAVEACSEAGLFDPYEEVTRD